MAGRSSGGMLGDCERIAATYREGGRRPIVDEVLEVVLSDCPDCHAQDTDPLGLWRPLTTIPRARTTTIECQACGVRRVLPA